MSECMEYCQDCKVVREMIKIFRLFFKLLDLIIRDLIHMEKYYSIIYRDY